MVNLICLLLYYLPCSPMVQINELQKCSYHLIAINWNKRIVYNSTGFFIKRDNRLFFITASHTLTGWNAMQLVSDFNYPDEIGIIFHRNADDKIEPFGIDLKPFKANQKYIKINDNADIAIIEMDVALKEKFKINSIEKYLGDGNWDDNHKISIFGFTKDYPPGTNLRNIIKDNSQTGYVKHIEGNSTKGINYETQVVDGIVTAGSSGSPVFSILNGCNSAMFNGVCVGGEPGSPRFPKLLIVKPEYINKAITELLSKKPLPIPEFTSCLLEWIKMDGLE
jgi:hypothetical protein